MQEKKIPNWKEFLEIEFSKAYMQDLQKFLEIQEDAEKTIFPPKEKIFSAFKLTPIKNIKVVILGQDPYHGKNQANGLAFSVEKSSKLPPSLKNIFKEISSDTKKPLKISGDLTDWAEQGVLLLNSVLSVEEKKPGSHANKGWEDFSDQVIEHLNSSKKNLVFLLWGKSAQEKGKFIDTTRHLKLTSAHPSPFSCYRGFFGCKHFSKTNNYLLRKNLSPINW
jgi:uracil-DNA glycosylase